MQRRGGQARYFYSTNFRFRSTGTPTHLDLSPLYLPPFSPTVQTSSLTLKNRISILRFFWHFSSTTFFFFSSPSHIFLPIHYLSPVEVGKLLFVPLPFLHSCFPLMFAENPTILLISQVQTCKNKGNLERYYFKIVWRKSFLTYVGCTFYFIFCIWLYYSRNCAIIELPQISKNITICTAITIPQRNPTQLHHTTLLIGRRPKHRPLPPSLKPTMLATTC